LDRHDRRSTPLPGTGGGVVSVVTVADEIRPTAAMIEAIEVFFDFGQTPALRGASVSIREGEILAVMVQVARASRRFCTAWRGSLCQNRGDSLVGYAHRHLPGE